MSIDIQRRAPNDHAVGALPADLHPVLVRVYRARGVQDAHQLERSLASLLPHEGLKGMAQAVDLLVQQLGRQGRMLIIGDFDADGATSSALAVRALRLMGAQHVDYLVPNRFQFGYGLTPEIVAVAAQRRPDLIITVDNGISSIEGVRAARALGIQVLVTDHHLPGATLPEADAIVNPNQPGDSFASKALAGVGVVFYLMLALRARLRDAGYFTARGEAAPNLAQLLDLVALGTVADVVPLDHNNRILVGQGLARIREGQCQSGIRALIQVAKRQRERLVAADLGFALGPRLNAAGRLEDMSLGIECLLCDDDARAQQFAAQLDDLNQQRRFIEDEMKQQALAQLKALHLDPRADLPLGLCLYDPEWHQGVIGILASRIKDLVHRPVIAFALADTGELKGSARSVAGVHIRDVLDAIAAQHPELLHKFGGHAMAAGLSLKEADLPAFSAAFAQELAKHLDPADLLGVVHSDGGLASHELSLELAELLRAGGPWGQGFAEPLFDGVFHVLQRRVVGERHLKLTLRPQDGAQPVEAIAFNTDERALPATTTQVRAAYRLDVNEYRGSRSVQLVIQHLEPLVDCGVSLPAFVATP